MLSSLFLIFAISVYLRFTASSPVYTESRTANLQNRDTHNCTNLYAEANTLCWDELDISDYLASWNRTTPTCETSSGGSDCCRASEPWTTCFLRLAYGTPGADCTQLDPQRCISNQLSTHLDSSIAPKVGYVVRNIVSVNSLFSSYYQGESSPAIRCIRRRRLGADWIFLALLSHISSMNAESGILYQIPGWNADVGTTLNNASVAKALAAGLPFWGVRLLPLSRKFTR